MNRLLLTVGALLAAVAAVYSWLVRPRMLRWGATDDEVAEPFPGDEFVDGGKRSATMATTINAPPERVWPWLLQMGTDRGGWYSWDHLDNFGRRSADRLHLEWQDVAVGSRMNGKPDGSQYWEVVALEPERFLCLRISLDLKGRQYDPAGPRPRFFTDSTWGFQLKPLPEGRTRLIVSGYWAFAPALLQPVLSFFALEPSHWIMQTRQFANLKRLAEGAPAVVAEPAVDG